MTDLGVRDEHLFVVRVWREAGAAGPNAWRGSVEHVESGLRRYFVDLDDLRAFIVAEAWHAQA
jgi:hypothetical protein